MSKVHPISKAFTISGSNGLYNSARPNYPPAAISKILSLSPTIPKLKIVELGAGTGIFTRSLLSIPDSNRIESIMAIEPSEGMRKSFLETVVEKNVKIEIKDGTFEAMEVDDASADIVIAAQAFHWVRDDEGAIKEIARVLRPGGNLVLIWNLEDRSTEWVAQLRDVYEKYEAGTPQLGLWKSIYELASYDKLFEPPQFEKFHRNLPSTEEGVINRVLSKSYITILEEQEKTEVVEKVKQVLNRGEGRIFIDEEKKIFEYPYETDMFIMQRK